MVHTIPPNALGVIHIEPSAGFYLHLIIHVELFTWFYIPLFIRVEPLAGYYAIYIIFIPTSFMQFVLIISKAVLLTLWQAFGLFCARVGVPR